MTALLKLLFIVPVNHVLGDEVSRIPQFCALVALVVSFAVHVVLAALLVLEEVFEVIAVIVDTIFIFPQTFLLVRRLAVSIIGAILLRAIFKDLVNQLRLVVLGILVERLGGIPVLRTLE